MSGHTTRTTVCIWSLTISEHVEGLWKKAVAETYENAIPTQEVHYYTLLIWPQLSVTEYPHHLSYSVVDLVIRIHRLFECSNLHVRRSHDMYIELSFHLDWHKFQQAKRNPGVSDQT